MTTYEQKLQELEEIREIAAKRIPYILLAGVCLGLWLSAIVQWQKPVPSPYTETGQPKIGWGWWV